MGVINLSQNNWKHPKVKLEIFYQCSAKTDTKCEGWRREIHYSSALFPSLALFFSDNSFKLAQKILFLFIKNFMPGYCYGHCKTRNCMRFLFHNSIRKDKLTFVLRYVIQIFFLVNDLLFRSFECFFFRSILFYGVVNILRFFDAPVSSFLGLHYWVLMAWLKRHWEKKLKITIIMIIFSFENFPLPNYSKSEKVLKN